MSKSLLFFVASLLVGNVAVSQDTWTDSTGKFSVKAKFKEIDAERKVVLEKDNGEKVSLPFLKLSSKSQLIALFLASEKPALLQKLGSNDRGERLAAADQLLAGGPLPGLAKSSLLDLLQKEVAFIRTPAGKSPTPTFDGNETSLLKVKADPQKFVGKDIVFCGQITASTYYNYGYDNAEKTHYALKCTELPSSGERGEDVDLYVSREFSELLVERVSDSQDGIIVRLHAKIDPRRYEGADTWDLMELYDWQYYNSNSKKWERSTLEGMKIVLSLMSNVTDASALMSIVESTKQLGTTDNVDLAIRAMAVVAAEQIKMTEEDIETMVRIITAPDSYGPPEFDARVRQSGALIASKASPIIRRKTITDLKKSRIGKKGTAEEKWANSAVDFLETVKR